jgi:D-threo-aldose 1-dehydrogenase
MMRAAYRDRMSTSSSATLGSTDVRVSPLSLGGTPFGDMYATVTDEAAISTVHSAFDAGVRYFDTAPLYGVGKAERRLGAGLRALPRDEVVVSTKIGRILQDDDGTVAPTFEYSPEAVAQCLSGSYERLGLERVDVVHVHDPDNHMDEVEQITLPALRNLQRDGVIRAVSAGMNHSAPLARFVASGLVDCVLLAGRWTLLDQSALDDLLPAAVTHGASVIAAGVFNSGVLADPDADERFANFFYRPAPPEIVERVRHIRDVCADHGVALRAAALQFPLTHPAVATVCVGCRSPEEVRANAGDMGADIPTSLWSDLAAAGLLRPDAVPAGS